jgi:hypothetical protein
MGPQNFERKNLHLDGVRSLTVFEPNSARRRRASAPVKPIGTVAVAAALETSIAVACSTQFTNWLLRQNTCRSLADAHIWPDGSLTSLKPDESFRRSARRLTGQRNLAV